MARQTRAQRRARREAQEQNQTQNKNQQGITQRARARQAQMRPGAQPVKSQAGAQRREKRSFVSASCPLPKDVNIASFNFARSTYVFEGGTEVSAVLKRECKARG